jgi:predicted nucleic acid-binding protein
VKNSTATVFVDTNVLVYARDLDEPSKSVRAAAWMEALWRCRRGRVSYQVLNEYYATVTQRLREPATAQQAREDVLSLLAWNPVVLDRAVTEGAWHIVDNHSCSWRDALILSAARLAGCRFVLTEDLQAAGEYGGLLVLNPFETAPHELDE